MITAGEACRGVAWDGSVGRGRLGSAGCGGSRSVAEWLGRHGQVRFGSASHGTAALRMVWLVPVGSGEAGVVRRVMDRRVTAIRGMAGVA
jgi:hypothetical protein